MIKSKNRITLIILCLLIIAVIVQKIYLHKNPPLYKNFGICIPDGYEVHGIDVSHYQKEIDWQLASKMMDKGVKLDFAIIKATEGLYQKDNFFEDNWEDCKKNGFVRGAYHYFYANTNGKAQANFFIKNAPLQNGDLPPIVDVEETKGTNDANLKKQLLDCMVTLENKYKCKPIIYCNVDFYKKHLGEDFNNYPLWAAHYYQSSHPDIDREWTMWQHNDSGHVNGINGFVDFNVMSGGKGKLYNMCIENNN